MADCVQWTGKFYHTGYGRVGYELAHRIAFKKAKGDIPKGLQIDHLCRNRACVNPDHLEAVTIKENVLRGEGITAVNLRKTHCLNGHEFSDKNTYRRKDRKTRECRTCRYDATKRFLERKEGK